MLYSEYFSKCNFNTMLAVIRNLAITYGLTRNNGSQIYVDASATAFIRSLKLELHENPNYEDIIARAKGFKRVSAHWLGLVIPVPFRT